MSSIYNFIIIGLFCGILIGTILHSFEGTSQPAKGPSFQSNASFGDSKRPLDDTKKTYPFAVLIFTNDTESIDVLRKHFGQESNNLNSTKGQNYVIESLTMLDNTKWLFDKFPNERKMAIGPSLASMRMAIENDHDHSIDVIAYDIESWSYTPDGEKADPLSSIKRGAALVNASGYRYGITPDAQYLLENYKMIDWKDIDFVALQLQQFSNDTRQFAAYTHQVSNFIKSVNPNTEIFAQVSFRFTDTGQMIRAIESVKGSVDGFLIVYLPNDDSPDTDFCTPRCNPKALDMVLDRIGALDRDQP